MKQRIEQKMNKNEYFKKSREIANKLNFYLNNFCKDKPHFKKVSMEYTKKEIHLNGSQFFAGFYSTNSNKKIEPYLDIAIIIELIMIRAYKTNRIIDHKQEIWESSEKIKETVLDENILLSLILQLLKNSKSKIKNKKIKIIEKIIFQLIENLSYGFQIEKEKLNIKNASIKDIITNWDINYKKRNHLFDSLYDYAPLIGYYLATGNKNIFKDYKKNFLNKNRYSHVGQIINDLSDFISIYDKNIKSYQDSFSDLRNGIITFPIYKLIKKRIIKSALKNPKITKNIDWKKSIIKIIKNSNLIREIKQISKRCYIDNINFWKNHKINNEFLFSTYSLLLNNKYFKKLEN